MKEILNRIYGISLMVLWIGLGLVLIVFSPADHGAQIYGLGMMIVPPFGLIITLSLKDNKKTKEKKGDLIKVL